MKSKSQKHPIALPADNYMLKVSHKNVDKQICSKLSLKIRTA